MPLVVAWVVVLGRCGCGVVLGGVRVVSFFALLGLCVVACGAVVFGSSVARSSCRGWWAVCCVCGISVVVGFVVNVLRWWRWFRCCAFLCCCGFRASADFFHAGFIFQFANCTERKKYSEF